MTEERTPLPSHTPFCFGCGTENPSGLGLQAWKEGEEIRGKVSFGPHHAGAPAFAHGGAVATALDDCLGFLLYSIGEPGVTARLEVNYRRPVLLNTEYRLRGWLNHREGRKIYTSIEMTDADGTIVAEGSGLFVVVTMDHFAKELPTDWRQRAEERGIELPW